ncbi:MAG TPA: phosphatase PAP2 family protein [Herpetosiphonaceae bacterium]|nr:phosphatase PAP2 family protein [Herpetosiphonaceae bacterium]
MIESTQGGRQADMRQTTIAAGSSILFGLAAALLALGLFGLLAFSFGRGAFLRLDDRALAGAYALRSTQSWLTPLMAAATAIGTLYGLAAQAAAVAGLLWWRQPRGWRSSLALLLITLIGASLFFVALKNQFDRPRPQIYPSPYSHSTFSFPSGHATTAAAFYGGLAVIGARSDRRRTVVAAAAAALAALIGTSRLYFSVHYPTDVLGGFCAGLGWLIAIQTTWHGIAWRRDRLRRSAKHSGAGPEDHRAAGVDRQP